MEDLDQFRLQLHAADASLKSLLNQLRPGLEEGRWSAFLGDDVSGRGPAYIIDAFSREVATSHQPTLLFFAGGVAKPTPNQMSNGDERNVLLKEYFNSHLGELGKRVLIITDTIDSGQTVLDAAQILRELGIAADVASVGATDLGTFYINQAAARDLELSWYIGLEQVDNSEVLSAPKKSNHLYGVRKEGILPQTVPLEGMDHELVDAVRRDLESFAHTFARQ